MSDGEHYRAGPDRVVQHGQEAKVPMRHAGESTGMNPAARSPTPSPRVHVAVHLAASGVLMTASFLVAHSPDLDLYWLLNGLGALVVADELAKQLGPGQPLVLEK